MEASYETLNYLAKFLDEKCIVTCNGCEHSIIGTCTSIKCDDNDCDHITLVLTEDNGNTNVYEFWQYDYKKQTWYDGIRHTDHTIKLA